MLLSSVYFHHCFVLWSRLRSFCYTQNLYGSLLTLRFCHPYNRIITLYSVESAVVSLIYLKYWSSCCFQVSIWYCCAIPVRENIISPSLLLSCIIPISRLLRLIWFVSYHYWTAPLKAYIVPSTMCEDIFMNSTFLQTCFIHLRCSVVLYCFSFCSCWLTL